MMKKLPIFISLAVVSAVMMGCTSEPDKSFSGFGAGYHPFGSSEAHGAYMRTNSYPFAQCAQCHGADLRGVPGTPGGEKVRSCYECHSSRTHIVYFQNALNHPSYLAAQRWKLDDCYTCHTPTNAAGAPTNGEQAIVFGGSCSATGCHSAPSGPENCNTCHGKFVGNPADSADWAPPTDLTGNRSTLDRGVGAHQAHLPALSGQFARVGCAVCHTVPGSVGASSHIDTTAGAEIAFSGLALADSSHPEWKVENGSCSATYCHGAGTPVWTQVDGTWNACGSCHGIPPASHPEWVILDYCYLCHGSMMGRHGVIEHPELHINGRVDRTVQTLDDWGTAPAASLLNQ